MAKTAVFTIVSNNYAAYACVLMQSLQRSNPDLQRFVCLVDEPDGMELGDVAGAECVLARSIGMPDFEDMAFRYDVMELNTAAKPFMFRWLLNDRDFERAIYLDPDIFVYRRLDDVERLLDDGHSAVLTPHLLRPLDDGARPDDHDILKSGVFNLGFAAIARTGEAMQFIDWWGRKLRFHGYSDVTGNMFTDQRWCDFAPCLIENLAILRHPGYNVAYWNLSTRMVGATDDAVTIDGEPLIFFHFSGLRFEEPKLVSKHQDRLQWRDLGPARQLFEAYRKRLLDNGWEEQRKRGYAYGSVAGIKIVEPVRGLYRRRYPRHVPASGAPDTAFILRMCNQRIETYPVPQGAVLTQLMLHIYENRPDLRAAFDFGRRDGVARFIRWFDDTPEREYGLDPRLTRQSLIRQTHVEPLADAAADPIPNAGRSPAYRLWRKTRKRLLGLGVR